MSQNIATVSDLLDCQDWSFVCTVDSVQTSQQISWKSGEGRQFKLIRARCHVERPIWNPRTGGLAGSWTVKLMLLFASCHQCTSLRSHSSSVFHWVWYLTGMTQLVCGRITTLQTSPLNSSVPITYIYDYEIFALKWRARPNITYFHCACAETGIILFPVKIRSAPLDSGTPKTEKVLDVPVRRRSWWLQVTWPLSHIFTAHAQKRA